MALFGRNSSANTDVPEDLQQYYSNAGGTGVFKWILRIVAGVIVLALLVWGGIWVAHKITNGSDNKPQTAGNSTQTQDQKKAQQQAAQAQADAKKAAEEAQKKAAAAAQAQQQQQQTQQPSQVATNGPGTTGSSTTGGSSTTTPNTPAQPQSTTGGSGGSLPNTGPGETAVVLFAGATVLGAAAHALVTRKRQLR